MGRNILNGFFEIQLAWRRSSKVQENQQQGELNVSRDNGVNNVNGLYLLPCTFHCIIKKHKNIYNKVRKWQTRNLKIHMDAYLYGLLMLERPIRNFSKTEQHNTHPHYKQ